MAFEKMTTDELYNRFVSLFPVYKAGIIYCEKIGARAIKITLIGGRIRYFIWYNDENWTFGTKLYRKRPEKQKKVEAKKKELTDEVEKLKDETERTKRVSTLMARLYGLDFPEDEGDSLYEQELNLRAAEDFTLAEPIPTEEAMKLSAAISEFQRVSEEEARRQEKQYGTLDIFKVY